MRLLVGWWCCFSAFHILRAEIMMPTHSMIEVHHDLDESDPFPLYTVAIEKRLSPALVGTPHCAGIVLSPKLVLTPCRQCLRNDDTVFLDGEIYVIVPVLENQVVRPHVRNADIVLRHPNCYNHRFEYWPNCDVGVIKLREDVPMPKQNFAYLPTDAFKFPMEDRVVLSNFRFGNVAATTMREATWAIKVKIHRLQLCKELLNVTNPCNNFYCTGYYHIGADFCQPDIGSPLSVYFERKQIFVAVGMLIKKVACGCHKSPGIYVMTKHVRPWIQKVAVHMKEKIRKFGP